MRAYLLAPRQQFAFFGGLLARTLEQAVELLSRHLLERTEVGPRQRGPFKVTQKAGAVAALLGLEDAALTFEVALRLLESTPLLVQRAAPRDLVEGAAPVLVADLAGRLAVEVEAVRTVRDRLQVRGAAGVAAEEGGERLLRKHPGRSFLDVDLDAQLERLRSAAEQRRKALAQQRSAIAMSGALVCRRGRRGCGRRRSRLRRIR